MQICPDHVACLDSRWIPVRKLGSGSMATVFLALDSQATPPALVAIKLAHLHLRDCPHLERSLAREELVARAVDHPRVVPVLGRHGSTELANLVMPYIEGANLARVFGLRDRGLPGGTFVLAILDALTALESVHSATLDGGALGIVHRDLCPSNLLLDHAGHTHLIDFGVARIATDVESGELTGTIAFMSPEQARGEDVDRRADLFSLGATLWLLLTGEHPFARDTNVEAFSHLAIGEGDIVRAQRRPTRAVESVCRTALARDPSDRFATAADMAIALREAANRDRLPLDRIQGARLGVSPQHS